MDNGSHALKRILVATDLSDKAGVAIDRAIELGIEHRAEVIIVHIVDESLPPEVQSFLTTTSDHDIRGKLAKHPRADQVTTTIDIVSGQPDLDIVERAAIENADLIVVGLHNRILVENLAIQGTVAESIIQSTHLPVLVVKNGPRAAYRSAVVGVDFSPFSQVALQTAATIAPNATLHMVHAVAEATSPKIRRREDDDGIVTELLARRHARMEAFVEQEMAAVEEKALGRLARRPKVLHASRVGAPHDVLRAEAERVEADLIAIGTHGRIGLSQAIMGSVAIDVLNDRLTDVLVVRPF